MSAAAIGTKVGTGYVDVQPKFARDFQETIGRKLNEALTPAMRKVGKQAGKDIAEGASDRRSLTPVLKRFEKLGSEANAAIARGLRKRQASKNAKSIADGLGLDEMSEFFARARKDAERSLPLIERLSTRLRSRLRPLGADFKSVGREVRQLAGQHLRGLGAELRKVASEFRKTDRRARVTSSGFGGFDGAMARVNRSAQFFRSVLRTIKWPVFIAGLGLSLQGLSALAAGTAAAAFSLGSLSGLLVTLPAAALAAAQAFGVLKLATGGVGDAVKAALDLETQGGGQAVDTMRQQRDAAERVADAKRSLAATERQAVLATDDYRRAHEEARRELEDLRFAADEADESIESAAIGLKRAKQELARSLRDPDSSALDVREAELSVEQAENDLRRVRSEAKRAREDYRSAQEAGVKGMPQVVAAKRAEEDANRSVDDAQRDLTRAIEDGKQAMQEQGSAASAYHDKMSQLPPAAQKFVRVLVGMKGRLDVLRNAAAEGFFPGAEDGLKGLMGNFKEVRQLVSGTAGVLGRIAAKAGEKLGSAVWGRDLSRLGKLNDRILGRLGDTTLNLAEALRHVMVTAEPFLDWLSAGTEKLSALVMEEAAAGRESGRLAEFFDRTRQTMELLGPILKGVGGGLLNVSAAADDLGNEILESLGDAAEGWRKWTDSTKGQNRLKTYFTETKPAVFEMGRLVRDVVKTFFELGKQRGVAHLLRLVRTELVPAFRDLVGATTGWASGFLKDFGRLRDQGVPTFDAFVRVLAEHAGEAGVKIAKALFTGFVNASIWGKLAIGGFLLSKFGGKGKVLAAGAALGRWLGIGIGAGAASTAVGAGAGTAAGGAAAGGILGGIAGKLKAVRWGRIGGIGLGLALADATIGEFGRRAKMRSDDIVVALEGTAESTLGKGSFLGDKDMFGIQIFQSDEGAKAENLLAQLKEMGETRVRISAETEASLRKQAEEVDLTATQRRQLEQMFNLMRQGRKLGLKVDLNSGATIKAIREYMKGFDLLRSGLINRMGDISKVTRENIARITAVWKDNPPKWRKSMVEAMQAAIAAIRSGMRQGVIETDAGQKRIRELARNLRLYEGRDPLGIAEGFRRGWKEAGTVTEHQISSEINQLKKLPKGAREQARDAMVDMAREMESKGELVKGSAARLNSALVTKFGRTNSQIESSTATAMANVAASAAEGATNTGGALKNIFDNLAPALAAVGASKIPKFSLKVLSAASQYHHTREKTQNGFGGIPKRQEGGFIAGGLAAKVPGNSTGDRHVLALNGVPVAKVESREGIFVGNREYMGALERGNAEHPRFQMGGLVAGPLQHLRRGGLVEPQLEGPDGVLKQIGRSAVHKVFEGAKDYLDKHRPMAGAAGAVSGSGPVEEVFARVAKKLSRSKTATLALGEAGFAESGMRDLGYGDSSSEGALQLLASTASGLGIDPHDEAAVASHFLLRGYWGKGGANALARQGLPAHLVAQSVQGSAFSDGSNYLAQEGPAKQWMRRFGLQSGGLVKRASAALRQLASGGMVDPSWDPGSETIASSIEQVVHEYAKRYDANITQGYGPGGPSVSKGHTTTGTSTDVVPRSGNWDGKFAEGLKVLADHGIQVGYDGSIPGTDAWEGHGRGDHAHINWVGYAENETAADARQRLRAFFSTTGAAGDPDSVSGASSKPKEDLPPPVKFGPMPENLEGVDREIVKREGERQTTLKAKRLAEKDGKPEVAEALGRNVVALEERLRGLRGLRTRLRLEKVKQRLTKRLKGVFGKTGGYEQMIAEAEREFTTGSQDAEQIVALEPQPDILPANATDAERQAAEKAYVARFTDHLRNREEPAYQGLLGKAADWRNTILRAQTFGFGKGNPSVAGMQNQWEGKARFARFEIDRIKDFSAKVAERLRDFKAKAKGGKDKALPAGLKDQVAARDRMRQQLPGLQFEDDQLTEYIGKARELFYPGGEKRLFPPPKPLAGTGSLEDALVGVQGIHWPGLHELLGSLPVERVAGKFGGVIWDVQTSIADLGLKIREAAAGVETEPSTEDTSEREALLRGLLAEGNQEKLVREVERRVLGGREWIDPDRLPKYHSGGVVRAGPYGGREVPAMLEVGEGVIKRTDMEELSSTVPALGVASAGNGPQVAVYVYEGEGRAEVEVNGELVDAVVEKVERNGRRQGRAAGRRRAASAGVFGG